MSSCRTDVWETRCRHISSESTPKRTWHFFCCVISIGGIAVGLSWQQGPLSAGAIGRFLVPEPLPKRLLYVEPLRRRMRVRFGGTWIAESENVLVLFGPGRNPMSYFPKTDVSSHPLE